MISDKIYMNQFIVPQFIDVEDKIIGPITTRQFIMIIVGGLVLVLVKAMFDIAAFIFFALFVLVLIALFGFYKVNGRPFHLFLLNIIQTFKKPTLRIWRKIKLEDIQIISEHAKTSRQKVPIKIVGRSRISKLSLIADTGGVYKGEE